MDTTLLSSFKKKLLAVKDALTRQIAKLREPVNMGDDIDSFEEEADEATETVANAGMVETLKRRAHRVEDALQKMDQGKYGRCEKCHKEIEPALLNIDPESRYCRACKLMMSPRD
jgi:RNA polymerase-binding transcription factor DksA